MKALTDALSGWAAQWDLPSRLAYVAAPFAATTKEGEAANRADAERLGDIILAAGWLPIVPHRLLGANVSEITHPGLRPLGLALSMEAMQAVRVRGGLLVVLLEADATTRSSGVLAEIHAWRNAAPMPPIFVTRPMLRGLCETCGGAGRVICHVERLVVPGGIPRCLACEHGPRVLVPCPKGCYA